MRGIALLFLATAGVAASLAACDSSSPVKEDTSQDAGVTPPPGTNGADGGSPDGGKDCFDDPKTHLEIINACTDAEKITKNPALSRLIDGGLPPL